MLVFRCTMVVIFRAPPKAFALDAFKTYHRAYHGTSIDSILPILLDDGMLLLPG